MILSTQTVALAAATISLTTLPLHTPDRARHFTASQTVMVHLSRGTDDLHAASMAFKLATLMLEEGARVTVFLDLEGVRLADVRLRPTLAWGDQPPVAEYVDGFIAAGGTIMICPHCAWAQGLTPSELRPGITIADSAELAGLLLSADKVLDY